MRSKHAGQNTYECGENEDCRHRIYTLTDRQFVLCLFAALVVGICVGGALFGDLLYCR